MYFIFVFTNGGNWLLFEGFDLKKLKLCSLVSNSTQHVHNYQPLHLISDAL